MEPDRLNLLEPMWVVQRFDADTNVETNYGHAANLSGWWFGSEAEALKYASSQKEINPANKIIVHRVLPTYTMQFDVTPAKIVSKVTTPVHDEPRTRRRRQMELSE